MEIALISQASKQIYQMEGLMIVFTGLPKYLIHRNLPKLGFNQKVEEEVPRLEIDMMDSHKEEDSMISVLEKLRQL